MSEPNTKPEIIAALQTANATVERYFEQIPLEQFFVGSADSWSPGHHLQHLIQSNEPLIKALRIPKPLLVLVGGKTGAKRRYSAVVELYQQALAEGRAKATGAYAPNLKAPLDAGKKRQIVEGFSKAAAGVIAALELWDEKSLDRYALPHPVLGPLKIREMLFFTLYHNQHHLFGAQKRVEIQAAHK